MSTRSGKRIHGSIHENIANLDSDIVNKSEKKTRTRRLKENYDEVAIPRSKKRHNYVSYPADDEQTDNPTLIQKNGEVTTKVLITLKEQDLNVSVKNVDEVDSGRVVRHTRRTKKISENAPDDVPAVEIDNVKSKKKNKKNKKKKVVTEVDNNENVDVVVAAKKIKKRKLKNSNTVTEELEVPAEIRNLNRSNGSVDSFHSAAGSPITDVLNTETKSPGRGSKRFKVNSNEDSDGESLRHNDKLDKNPTKSKHSRTGNILEISNRMLRSDDKKIESFDEPVNSIEESSTNVKETKKKIKRSLNISTVDDDDKLSTSNRLLRSDNEHPKKTDENLVMSEEGSVVLNTAVEKKEKVKRKRKSSVKNSTFDENDKAVKELNITSEKINTPNKLDITSEGENKGRRKSLRSTYDKTETPTKGVEELNVTYEKSNSFNEINKTLDGEKNNQKSLRSTFDKTDTPLKDIKKLNSTFEKVNTPSKAISNVGDNNTRRKSLRSTFDKIDTLPKISRELYSFGSATPGKEINTLESGNNSKRISLRQTMSIDRQAEKGLLNTTFENCKESSSNALDKSQTSKLNSTFDKSKDDQQTTINSTFEKSKKFRQSMNTTFEKSMDSKISTLDTTFDKEQKLNSTYDKPENELESERKSSLISSDSASNLTFDKSDEISRISITSDDSNVENIVNTTPLLIESSMENSRVQESSPKDESSSSDNTKLKTCVTPLKREGTFTKDSPEVTLSQRVNVSLNRTPVKRMSLPSPGSTPFPLSKSSQKEKSLLNVTRSIEKSVRRSSLVEAAPRQTRVMFCSPVNNPVVVMQQKGKVIKSNLKGSNKSFIFDESVSESVRPGPRKRSYTHGDADDSRVKRKRLADDQLQSVARLSRPRTSSATAKLAEPSTPSKNPITPSKKNPTPSNGKSEAKVGRTKLPNFAALHQKNFAKMESLDECQLRRAKRARQLLTPTGALAIIEKSSPKGKATAEPTKAVKEVPKKPETKLPKKTDTEPKKSIAEIPKKNDVEVPNKPDIPSDAIKTFPLDSLRTGYTRFGFKMNLDVNPFSVPPKTSVKPKESNPFSVPPKMVAKPKETKSNGLGIRQPSQPSLAGATSGRREVAKQIVMRERSFTSLSDKRQEKRTMIKGVRTNRRFELQMKLRNINS